MLDLFFTSLFYLPAKSPLHLLPNRNYRCSVVTSPLTGSRNGVSDQNSSAVIWFRHRSLRGLVPQDLVAKLSSARNQIVLVAETTDGSVIGDLLHSLEEYLPVLIGLIEREHGLEGIVEFKWKNLDNGRQEICVASSWFELSSVVHLMAVLTLSEANLLLIPKYDTDAGLRIVTADSRSEAFHLLLKASRFLEFCYRDILAHLPSDIKKRLPGDFQEDALEAISIQVLCHILEKKLQATEIQIGLAVESRNASLSVKRKLACSSSSSSDSDGEMLKARVNHDEKFESLVQGKEDEVVHVEVEPLNENTIHEPETLFDDGSDNAVVSSSDVNEMESVTDLSASVCCIKKEL